jgi:multidrug transporter EmrE-like cation transporter
MRTPIVLSLSVLTQVVGNLLLSKGMKEAAAAGVAGGEFVSTAVHAAVSPTVWSGIIVLAAFFLLNSALVSWVDLSFVLPATSVAYVLNVAAGHYLLHESVGPLRWAGSIIICLGVVLVSRTKSWTVTGSEEEATSLEEAKT